jgi:hypothetical protein
VFGGEPVWWTPQGLLWTADAVVEGTCVDGDLVVEQPELEVHIPFNWKIPWGPRCTGGKALAFLKRWESQEWGTLDLWTIRPDGGVVLPTDLVAPPAWFTPGAAPTTLQALRERSRRPHARSVTIRSRTCTPCQLMDVYVERAFSNGDRACWTTSCLADGGVWRSPARDEVVVTTGLTIERFSYRARRPRTALCGGNIIARQECDGLELTPQGVVCQAKASTTWCEETVDLGPPRAASLTLRCMPQPWHSETGQLFRCSEGGWGEPVWMLGDQVECIEEHGEIRCEAVDEAGAPVWWRRLRDCRRGECDG